MAERTVEVRFGGEQVEFLSISVRGRAYRQSKDYWDGNWLLVTVIIHAGKFTGEVPGMLRAEELAQFSRALQELQKAQRDSLAFTTAEGWLGFQVEADKPGSLRLAGTVNDDVSAPYNSLRFAFPVNSAVLAPALKQLARAVTEYPVIGKP